MKHNWEYKKFGEIASTITPNKKLDKSNYMLEGQYPIISQEECFISGYWNESCDLTRLDVPVVIFGDHSRVLKYIDFDFVVGADGVKIIKTSKLLIAKFLFYYLQWLKIPSLGYSRHFKLVKESHVPVPPREVQERIVAELDAVNEGIAELREQVKDLDSLAKSLFYETFGDPISNPKAWPVKKISSFAKTTSGGTPSKSQPNYYKNGKIPWLRSGEVNQLFIRTTELYITEIGLQNSSAKIIPSESVVVAMYGATASQVGIIKTDMSLNQAICGIYPNSETHNIFLYFCLVLLKSKLLKKAHGAAQPNISQNIIKNLDLPVPPLALQQQFAKQIEEIEAMKQELEAQIAEAKTLLDSRMDYWFN